MFGETDNVDFQPASSAEFTTPPTIPTAVSEQSAEKPAKLNKSQAVRDYDAAHPGKAAIDVVAGLATQGIEVTKALVDNTRWYDKMKAAKANPKKAGKKAAKKAAVKKATPPAHVMRPAARELTVAELQRFKTVIDELGGIIVAKVAIAYLERFSK